MQPRQEIMSKIYDGWRADMRRVARLEHDLRDPQRGGRQTKARLQQVVLALCVAVPILFWVTHVAAAAAGVGGGGGGILLMV